MPPDEKRRQIAGILLVLASCAAFAMSPTAARFAFEAGGNTLTVATLRAAVGVVLIALLLAATRESFWLPAAALGPSLAAGALSAIVSYGFVGAVAFIPVGLALLVFFTHPLLIAALWHWQGKERFTLRKLILALVVLAGLGLAIGTAFDGLDPRGILLAALASVAVTGMIAFSARARQLAGSAPINLLVAVVSAGLTGGVTTALGAWAFPIGTIGWLGVLGAGLGTTLGLLMFLASFRYVSPVRATMLSNVEPVFGILFAMALLGEWLTPLQWAGVALVVAGLVLFEMPARKRD
jgi:drug/metabolite transporter (DMT)-like permease